MNVTDGRTDGRTTYCGITALCVASHGKKTYLNVTDGRTDGRTTYCGITALCVASHCKNIPERHRRTDTRTDDLLWHNRALRSIVR